MPKGSWREFDSATSRPDKAKSLLDKGKCSVRVHKTRGGKGGKTVTVINGLELDEAQFKSLLKNLKARCGAGGTFKGKSLELQGDHVEALLVLLQEDGYRPKKSGG